MSIGRTEGPATADICVATWLGKYRGACRPPSSSERQKGSWTQYRNSVESCMYFSVLAALILFFSFAGPARSQSAISTPLQVHAANPNYFADHTGRAVY